jgi:hypothetical protein
MLYYDWENCKKSIDSTVVQGFFYPSSKKYYFCRRQIETETGSAGEQPVRDKFDRLTEYVWTGLSLWQSFLIYFEVVYA